MIVDTAIAAVTPLARSSAHPLSTDDNAVATVASEQGSSGHEEWIQSCQSEKNSGNEDMK